MPSALQWEIANKRFDKITQDLAIFLLGTLCDAVGLQ